MGGCAYSAEDIIQGKVGSAARDVVSGRRMGMGMGMEERGIASTERVLVLVLSSGFLQVEAVAIRCSAVLEPPMQSR